MIPPFCVLHTQGGEKVYASMYQLKGSRVMRGPNWRSGNVDGGEGKLGTIVSVPYDSDPVKVEWDHQPKPAKESNQVLIFSDYRTVMDLKYA